ncbi:capsule assembly Wzi family protein [Pseudoalteromonas ruthenica]|uniref:capsule assembly Wzi family protein n=1 Tax=Pseudoalteromonas ruthenica TaxID=151081 RepID=UPI00241CEB15|nr:capsule assembly Wzi family protein [Pseudoalteromonas ruthenica]
MRFSTSSLCTFLCLVSSSVFAEPWVKPDDYGLRADIQRLADAGVISAPVTTFPLMWNSFIDELRAAPVASLSAELQDAALRVRHRFESENGQPHNFQVHSFKATDPRAVTSFGMSHSQQTEMLASYSYLGENFAAKLAVNHREDGRNCYIKDKGQADIVANEQALEQCDDKTLDHSYIAYRLGNWIFRAGAVEQFWGPGIDNSLIMSTNAKPLPAISVSREKATAFETPWLSWIGPWSFTAQMAQLESTRVEPDAMLWSTRVNFRPLQQLEVALSWSAQWAGEGQPSSLGDFADMILGKTECANGADSCTSEQETKLGNQLAGLDVRWSDTLFSQPYALYVSTIGEDASSYFKPADRAYVFGAQTSAYAFAQNLTFNLEYIDTGVSCAAEAPDIENCYYEHSIYLSGYRYQGRTIGSAYDNDTQSWVFTVLGQQSNGHDWQVKLRQIDFNSDNSDRYPNNPDLGHSITKTPIDSQQLEARYRFLAMKGRFTVGGVVANNDTVEGSETDTSAYLKFEYNF